jgi:hypothetical protein
MNAADFAYLDELTIEEVSLFKQGLLDITPDAEEAGGVGFAPLSVARGPHRTMRPRPVRSRTPDGEGLRIVAEGDSWFDFPLETDIIDHLRDLGHDVTSVARRSDLLEQMVYTRLDRRRRPDREGSDPLDILSAIIQKTEADVFLFSGGGNDLLGPNFEMFVEHAFSGRKPELRTDVLDEYLTVVEATLEALIERVLGSRDQLHFLMHGYDVPFGSGRAAFRILWWNVVGPWLKPVFDAKQLETDGRDLLTDLVNRFYALLDRLADRHDRFHVVDLRGVANSESFWHDEIHLTSAGYKAAAMHFQTQFARIGLLRN